jgi:uncharacterized membrane protein
MPTTARNKEGIVNNWFSTSSGGSRFVFVLLVAYVIAAAVILLLVFGAIPSGYRYNQFLLLGFSLMSFAVTAVTSVFHLGTLIMRRKRSTDKTLDDETEK